MKKLSKGFKIVIILILLLTSFSFGWLSGHGNLGVTLGRTPKIFFRNFPHPPNVDFTPFWKTWDLIKKEYVGGSINEEKMLYGAISGMINSLGDPYTVFMTPEEAKVFSQELEGTFEGIGAEVGVKNGKIIVITPLDNSPAERAGLMPGDIILKIDDLETQGMTLDEAVFKIRGEAGSEVILTIMRKGFSDSKEFKIKREVIKIKSVIQKKIGNFNYIKISYFGEDTKSEFEKITSEVSKTNTSGIILDLRNNPGGYLETAIDVASGFIKEGAVVIEESKDGRKKTHNATGKGDLTGNTPLVVLINKGSASASEIVAGAIADRKRGTLLGETTFGKGTVQEVEEINGGAVIKLTIAFWLTPNGHSINEKGIIPDIKVEMTENDYNAGRDPQLNKAIEYLKNKLK